MHKECAIKVFSAGTEKVVYNGNIPAISSFEWF